MWIRFFTSPKVGQGVSELLMTIASCGVQAAILTSFDDKKKNDAKTPITPENLEPSIKPALADLCEPPRFTR